MKQIYLDNADKLSYKESLNKTIFLFRKKTRLNKEKLNLREKVNQNQCIIEII